MYLKPNTPILQHSILPNRLRRPTFARLASEIFSATGALR